MSSVLIVDDNPSDRARFRSIMSPAGYQIHEAARGGEALEKAREIRPRAILLDVAFADGDGQSICRALRAESVTSGVAILVLASSEHEADALACLDAGADDYVDKDSPPELVLARLRRLIHYRQLASVAVLNEHLVQVGRLLAGIVHEIRSPLAVIRGSAELMRYHLPPDDPNLQWVEPILRNALLLQVRLEHLMATVRSGPSRIEAIEVDSIVNEAADLFLKGTDPKGGKVTIDAAASGPRVRGMADAGRMLQILLSLFGNAHEANASSRPVVRISVCSRIVQEDGKDWIAIDVVDDGPGIPAELVDRIFEPFFTTKETGTGYGLYLASEILREQGGRLTVCNKPGSGACFTIWLPVAREPAEPARSAS